MIKSKGADLVGGKYKLKKKLGSGSFGSVYLAEQEAYGVPFRSVALKVFETEINDDMQAREIFNDAIVLARLLEECTDLKVKSHFVHIYDIGAFEMKDDAGEPLEKGYMAMELMEKDLRAIVGTTGSGNFRKTTVTEVLAYMKPLVDAIAYMHSQKPSILHRDLKPANVLFKYKNGIQIKVGDFGLALQAYNLFEPARAAGTMNYQDLESHILGTAATESDIYAMGIMFYELLTGRYPHELNFPGMNHADPIACKIRMEKLKRVMSKPIQPPSDLNLELKNYPWLEDIILKCLATYRADRIKDAFKLKRLIDAGASVSSGKTPQEKYKLHITSGDNAMIKGPSYWREAVENYQNAGKILTTACDAVTKLAHLYMEMGKLDKAEAILNERIRQNRACDHVFKGLSYVYAKRKNNLMEKYYQEQAGRISKCKYSVYGKGQL